MAEIRYGQPGLYAVGALGQESKNDRLTVYGSSDEALQQSIKACNRYNEWIVYELREVARVTMPDPVIQRVTE